MIGLYYRLSLADGNDESNSIVNQRIAVFSYLERHPELLAGGVETEEYVDDGFSGTNFDRPAFQRMLCNIQNGRIRVVIVKDFSRFGRDYIEVGDYTERLFPMLGVRLIAINDGYDSSVNQMGDSCDLGIIMKNLMNSYYSRDLSMKISTANASMIRQGEFLGSCAPMGYFLAPDNCHRMVVDVEGADYIRRIFSLAVQGYKTTEIARRANEERIPTPNQYLVSRGVRAEACNQKVEHGLWNREMVIRIIKNPVYKGTFVGQKTKMVYPCAGRVRRCPEEQVVIENMYEAIVTPEAYEQAQLIFRRQKYPEQREEKRYRLKGKVLCGNCHRAMVYGEQKKAGKFFWCRHFNEQRRDRPCVPGKISEPQLAEFVFEQSKKHIVRLQSAVQHMEREMEERKAEQRQVIEEIQKLECEIKGLQEKKRNLYERYSSGRVSWAEFKEESENLSTRVELCRKQTEEKKRKKSENYDQVETQYLQLRSLLHDAQKLEVESELTREMVELLLDQVIVLDARHVEVRWRLDHRVCEQ